MTLPGTTSTTQQMSTTIPTTMTLRVTKIPMKVTTIARKVSLSTTMAPTIEN